MIEYSDNGKENRNYYLIIGYILGVTYGILSVKAHRYELGFGV